MQAYFECRNTHKTISAHNSVILHEHTQIHTHHSLVICACVSVWGGGCTTEEGGQAASWVGRWVRRGGNSCSVRSFPLRHVCTLTITLKLPTHTSANGPEHTIHLTWSWHPAEWGPKVNLYAFTSVLLPFPLTSSTADSKHREFGVANVAATRETTKHDRNRHESLL